MKKIIPILVLFAFLVPSFSFASENLFYYFDNTNGLSDFKKKYKYIDTVAPQIYEIDYDLKLSKATEKKIIKEAKKKKVKTIPLLVNKKFDKVLMSDILINPSAQDQIIDSLIKEAEKNDYAGWQYDFENINHLDRDLYTAFVKKTYERLKAEDLEFSVAVIVRTKDYDPNSKDQDWSSGYDYVNLAKYSDFLSFMTYDDPNSYGPVASIPYVQNVLNYLLPKVPAEKISLGVPGYCWKWNESTRTKVGATTYELAKKAYRKGNNRSNGFDIFFGAEYFRYEDGGVKYEIWCDNDRSFERKLNIVESYGLRGISVWALGQEDPGIWKLMK